MGNVLVTGASTGIGEACALHLDRMGHRVFAGIRREADGERLRSRSSKRLEPVRLDVTDRGQVEAVADRLGDACGPAGLAGVVNNAGIAIGGPLEHLPLDEWRTQLEVNVVGQVSVTQVTLPLLRTARGRVVFIGSLSGRVSTPLMSPYGASKHAIEAVGESLREELRPWGIHVAVVEPGAVRTAIWDKGRSTADRLERDLPPDGRRRYGDQIDAIRRQIDAQERDGVDPLVVAEAVEHALFHRRPRYRYPVGRDARAVAVLDRLAPDRAMAAVIRRLGP